MGSHISKLQPRLLLLANLWRRLRNFQAIRVGTSNVVLSKLATNEQHGENSLYFDGWKAYDNDPFHPVNNPNGVIQLGLAENQLSIDRIEDWIKRNPKASICTHEGIEWFRRITNFQDYHGLPEFTTGIAKHMEKQDMVRLILIQNV
ncbi:hypothetical protein RDI58_013684 [Solanum bulbocastanum]|uniref:Aminotransferase class I/classII large domain-containing protein n=1 Tax=Solanum bulbocastanum TaxID=147425 RepID=A0AAN8TLI8_SOLBU